MIDVNSPEFNEYLERKIEQRLDKFKENLIREKIITREEFKEEMNKNHEIMKEMLNRIEGLEEFDSMGVLRGAPYFGVNILQKKVITSQGLGARG